MNNWIDHSVFRADEPRVPYRFALHVDGFGDVTVEEDGGDWWLVTSNMTVGLESKTADEAKLEALDYLSCQLAGEAGAVRNAMLVERDKPKTLRERVNIARQRMYDTTRFSSLDEWKSAVDEYAKLVDLLVDELTALK